MNDENEYIEDADSPDGAEAESYRLILKGNGMSLERNITAGLALQIVSLAMSGSSATVASNSTHAPRLRTAAPSSHNIQESVHEYVERVEATKHPEVILAIAAYLIDVCGQNTVTRQEIKNQFKNAGHPMPANFGRDLTAAITSGWLSGSHGSDDELYVTKKGRDALERQFQGTSVNRLSSQKRKSAGPAVEEEDTAEGVPQTSRNKGKAKAKRTSNKASNGTVDVVQLINALKNSAEYEAIEEGILHKPAILPRVLLPLYAFKQAGIEGAGLTSGDITRFYDQLRIKVYRPNVSNTLADKAKKFVFTNDTRAMGQAPRYQLSAFGEKEIAKLIGEARG